MVTRHRNSKSACLRAQYDDRLDVEPDLVLALGLPLRRGVPHHRDVSGLDVAGPGAQHVVTKAGVLREYDVLRDATVVHWN